MAANGIDQIYSILKYEGWITNKNWSVKKKIVYACYGVVSFGLYTFPLVLTIVRIRLKQSLAEDPSGIFFMLSEWPLRFCTTCFVLLLLIYRSEIKAFNKALQETAKIAREYSPITAKKESKRANRHSRSILHLLITVYCAFSVLFGLGIVASILSHPEMSYDHFPTITTDYDYGLDKNSWYWYIYVFEMESSLQVAMNLGIAVSFLLIVCTLIEAQVNILIDAIKRTKGVLRNDCGNKTGQMIRSHIKHMPGKRTDYMRHYVVHHQHILRLMKIMKSRLTPFLVVDIVEVFLVTANTIVSILVTEREGAQRQVAALYTIFTMAVFSIRVWSLVKLKHTLLNVSSVLYSVHSKLSRSEKKDCLLMMMRSQHDEKIPCLFTRSLTLKFVYKMLDLTWSYFALAQRKTRSKNI